MNYQRTAVVVVFALWVPGCPTAQDTGGSGVEGVTCADDERLVEGVCQPTRRRDSGRDTATDGSHEVGRDLSSEVCVVGERYCDDDFTAAVCEDGGTVRLEGCEEGQVCSDGDCVDSSTDCTEGTNIGCHDEHSYRLCDATGEGYDVVDCPPETPNCLGSGDCSSNLCYPDSRRCSAEDENLALVCASDGTGWNEERCDPGTTCDAGECLNLCEENSKVASFLGCDYWALDLDNIAQRCVRGECGNAALTCDSSSNECEPSAASQQFSISISNPNEDPVTVTVTNGSTGVSEDHTVGAETAGAISLDRLDVDNTGRSHNAYHITTSLPVTAHQFNPANNVGVFSNDASLLLPSNTAGLRYQVLTWPNGPFGSPDYSYGSDENQGAYGYATVVAVSEAETTTVWITPSVDVRAGNGMNAIYAATRTELMLTPGEVLSLQPRVEENRDLSGTLIESDEPVIVFAGHECAFIPDEEPLTLYCDHIEQQLFPVEAWGTNYIVAKFSPRGAESDVIRVIADVGGTSLTTTPPISGVNGRTLAAGEVLEFSSNQSFAIEGSNPILVAQFMTGSHSPGILPTCILSYSDAPCGSTVCEINDLTCVPETGNCGISCVTAADCVAADSRLIDPECYEGFCANTGIGDPAFMLSVPVSQYREDYIFLTPADYREDWFTAVVPVGTTLTYDGEVLPSEAFTEIPGTGFAVIDHSASNPPGADDPAVAHTLVGDQEFALQVYGYDCDVSYAYPGGLNLEPED